MKTNLIAILMVVAATAAVSAHAAPKGFGGQFRGSGNAGKAMQSRGNFNLGSNFQRKGNFSGLSNKSLSKSQHLRAPVKNWSPSSHSSPLKKFPGGSLQRPHFSKQIHASKLPVLSRPVQPKFNLHQINKTSFVNKGHLLGGGIQLPGKVKLPVKPTLPPFKGPIGINPLDPPHVKPLDPPGVIDPPHVGPISPPPICPPKHCPPKHCPPVWGKPIFCPPVGFCNSYPAYPVTYVNETIVATPAPVATQAAVVQTVDSQTRVQIPAGATITLQAAQLGTDPGQVVLEVNGISMPAQVVDWQASSVTATMPAMGVSAATPARLYLLRATGEVASTLEIDLVPAQP